jgi:predicted metal-dependent hydrolase
MTSTQSAGIEILHRKPTFNFSDIPECWLKDINTSYFMLALSAYIPASERLVIEILREQQEHIVDPVLKQEVKTMIKQEGTHARLHKEVNFTIKNRAWKQLDKLTSLQWKGLSLLKRFMPTSFVVSIPAAFEHFTYMVSKSILENQQEWLNTDRPDNEAAKFLKWHAFEELEHQAVCLDVYKYSGGRNWALTLSLVLFWMPLTALSVFALQAILLRKNQRLNSLKEIKAYAKFVYLNKGMFFSGAFHYLFKRNKNWSKSDKALYNLIIQEYTSDKQNQK